MLEHEDTGIQFAVIGEALGEDGSYTEQDLLEVVKKRMMFYKMVNHNVRMRKREVYLVGLYEDQAGKWENCLEPSDEIKAYDRTYKLIKDKLLRAVIEHHARLRNAADNNQGYGGED